MLMRKKYTDSQKSANIKRYIILSSVVFVVVCLCLWFFVIKDNYPIGAEKNNPTQQAADTQDKNDFINNPGAGTPDPDNVLSNGNTDESKVIVATMIEGDSVTVSTKLYGYSDGSCLVEITNGTKQHSETAPIIFQPEYSTCAGFSVKSSKLGAGNWSIKLTAMSKGQSVVKTVTLVVL